MTVARINISSTYHRTYRRPQGVEGAVYRLGMALVAWAHSRTRRPDEQRASLRRRSDLEHSIQADRDAALARATLTRVL